MVQALLMGLLALLNGIQGPYQWYWERSSEQRSTFLTWAGFLQEEQMPLTYTGQVCLVHL